MVDQATMELRGLCASCGELEREMTSLWVRSLEN
jgi:hypothetical protein